MRFELYQSADGSYTFLPHDHQEIRRLISEGAVRLWETDAATYYTAMQAWYTHMEWGTYHRQADWSDIIYDPQEDAKP